MHFARLKDRVYTRYKDLGARLGRQGGAEAGNEDASKLAVLQDELMKNFRKEAFAEQFKTGLKTAHQQYASLDLNTAARELVETYKAHIDKSTGDRPSQKSAIDKAILEDYFVNGLGCGKGELEFIRSALDGNLPEFNDAAFDSHGNLKSGDWAKGFNAATLSETDGARLAAEFIVGKLSGGTSKTTIEKIAGWIPSLFTKSGKGNRPDAFANTSDKDIKKTVKVKHDAVLARYLELHAHDKKNEVPEKTLRKIFNSIRKKGLLNVTACNHLLSLDDPAFLGRMNGMEISLSKAAKAEYEDKQDAVSRYLTYQNLGKQDSAGDGNCLYTSIGRQVGKRQQQVRTDLAQLYLDLCSQADGYDVTLSSGRTMTVGEIKRLAGEHYYSFQLDDVHVKSKVYSDMLTDREWGDNEQAFLAEIYYQRPSA